jgi:tryptophanyl-tRNA synthetase
MKRILTGDRPTADKFHLGNYVGSLANRVKMQDEYESFIMIADLHALTTAYDKTADLETNIRGLMLDYLSVGLDPKKVTFFLQSKVHEIVELSFILSTLTPRSIIAKQPALKEKLDQGASDTVGLFYYPVLMASDILTLRGNAVPVGKDQKAHVKYARDIAIKFNNQYGEVLTIPEPVIGEVPTLPGVDGQGKMGKSLNNAIFLADTAEEVERRVMGMYTDPTRLKATDPGHVEGNPVFIYLDAFGEDSDQNQIQEFKDRYQEGTVGDVEVKRYLAQVLNRFLEPIRARRAEYEKQPELVEQILKEGSSKAKSAAEETLKEVKKAMQMNYF